MTRGITGTYEWMDDGVHSLKERTGTVNAMDFSMTATRIHSFETVNVPSIAAMPSEPEDVMKLKEGLQAMGIKSFLILPLTNGPIVIGSLGFDTSREEVSWADDDIDILRIYGQIIAGALARKAADRAIHESE